MDSPRRHPSAARLGRSREQSPAVRQCSIGTITHINGGQTCRTISIDNAAEVRMGQFLPMVIGVIIVVFLVRLAGGN